MNGFSLGKLLIALGAGAILLGLVLLLLERFVHLGALPGDISFRGEHFSFYFPIVSCIVVSILLTVLLNLFRH